MHQNYDPSSDCSLMQKQVFLAKVFKIDSTITHLPMICLFLSSIFGYLLPSICACVCMCSAILRCICCGNMLHTHVFKDQASCHSCNHTHTHTPTTQHIVSFYIASIYFAIISMHVYLL